VVTDGSLDFAGGATTRHFKPVFVCVQRKFTPLATTLRPTFLQLPPAEAACATAETPIDMNKIAETKALDLIFMVTFTSFSLPSICFNVRGFQRKLLAKGCK
jgi:hypothetical protein